MVVWFGLAQIYATTNQVPSEVMGESAEMGEEPAEQQTSPKASRLNPSVLALPRISPQLSGIDDSNQRSNMNSSYGMFAAFLCISNGV